MATANFVIFVVYDHFLKIRRCHIEKNIYCHIIYMVYINLTWKFTGMMILPLTKSSLLSYWELIIIKIIYLPVKIPSLVLTMALKFLNKAHNPTHLTRKMLLRNLLKIDYMCAYQNDNFKNSVDANLFWF